MLKKIISGGQTGIDRAALDAAMDNDFACGGFCPKGRKAEDGVIPDKYPLQEHASTHYSRRTLENVLLADGTLIIYTDTMSSGTELTAHFCKDYDKPFLVINAHSINMDEAVKNSLEFIKQHNIETLNVAGPRLSQWKDGYTFAYKCLENLLKKVSA